MIKVYFIVINVPSLNHRYKERIFKECVFLLLSMLSINPIGLIIDSGYVYNVYYTYTHTHTHTYIYIYIYITLRYCIQVYLQNH